VALEGLHFVSARVALYGCGALLLFMAASGRCGPPAGAVAHLQYREVDFAPLAWEVEVRRGARFTKEPVGS
jgi:hypothetical protein